MKTQATQPSSATSGNQTKESSSKLRTKTASRIRRYGPLILWMVIISLASTGGFSAANTSRVIRPLLLWLFPDISESSMQLAHLIVRKLAHLTEYAVLGWLAARAFLSSSVEFLRRYWILAALLLIVFQAAMDEYHQSFVATRTGSPYDSLIDITGGVLALLLFAYFRARSKRVRQTSVCR